MTNTSSGIASLRVVSAESIDQLCDRYETELAAGRAPRIEEYLHQVPARLRPALFQELVGIHWQYAEQKGQLPTAEQYLDLAAGYEAQLAEIVPILSHGRATAATEVALPRRRILRVRCPDCHEPIELSSSESFADLSCTHCGSKFSLVDDKLGDTTPNARNTLAHFAWIRPLGAGRFGRVWLARDLRLDRLVAIKIPHAGSRDVAEIDRLWREAQSMAQLDHPGIVQVYEVGRTDGLVYFVTAFVDGESLAERISREAMSPREAAELVVQVADALHAAHQSGFVHRDVKPANILLDRGGKPHLADFGLARHVGRDITVTVAGDVLGTPAYMAPEQAQQDDDAIDLRSDVYSLGVTLYHLLTGCLPFQGNVTMTIEQILHVRPRPPRTLNDRIPQELEAICLKAMAREPEARYETAADFAADLQRYLDGHDVVARTPGVRELIHDWLRQPNRIMEAGVCLWVMTALQYLFAILSLIFHLLGRPQVDQMVILGLLLAMGVFYPLQLVIGYYTFRQSRLAVWSGFLLQVAYVLIAIGHLFGYIGWYNRFTSATTWIGHMRQWLFGVALVIVPASYYGVALVASEALHRQKRRLQERLSLLKVK